MPRQPQRVVHRAPTLADDGKDMLEVVEPGGFSEAAKAVGKAVGFVLRGARQKGAYLMKRLTGRNPGRRTMEQSTAYIKSFRFSQRDIDALADSVMDGDFEYMVADGDSQRLASLKVMGDLYEAASSHNQNSIRCYRGLLRIASSWKTSNNGDVARDFLLKGLNDDKNLVGMASAMMQSIRDPNPEVRRFTSFFCTMSSEALVGNPLHFWYPDYAREFIASPETSEGQKVNLVAQLHRFTGQGVDAKTVEDHMRCNTNFTQANKALLDLAHQQPGTKWGSLAAKKLGEAAADKVRSPFLTRALAEKLSEDKTGSNRKIYDFARDSLESLLENTSNNQVPALLRALTLDERTSEDDSVKFIHQIRELAGSENEAVSSSAFRALTDVVLEVGGEQKRMAYHNLQMLRLSANGDQAVNACARLLAEGDAGLQDQVFEEVMAEAEAVPAGSAARMKNRLLSTAYRFSHKNLSEKAYDMMNAVVEPAGFDFDEILDVCENNNLTEENRRLIHPHPDAVALSVDVIEELARDDPNALEHYRKNYWETGRARVVGRYTPKTLKALYEMARDGTVPKYNGLVATAAVDKNGAFLRNRLNYEKLVVELGADIVECATKMDLARALIEKTRTLESTDPDSTERNFTYRPLDFLLLGGHGSQLTVNLGNLEDAMWEERKMIHKKDVRGSRSFHRKDNKWLERIFGSKCTVLVLSCLTGAEDVDVGDGLETGIAREASQHLKGVRFLAPKVVTNLKEDGIRYAETAEGLDFKLDFEAGEDMSASFRLN